MLMSAQFIWRDLGHSSARRVTTQQMLSNYLYKLVDLIDVIRIKIITLNAECLSQRVGALSELALAVFTSAQNRIILLTLWFEEFLIVRQDSVWLFSKLMSLQNFFQLACGSILRLSLIFCCN